MLFTALSGPISRICVVIFVNVLIILYCFLFYFSPVPTITPSGPSVVTTVLPGQAFRKCDFEASNICNYIQDRTDRFNWQRTTLKTATFGTGPSADHTYGTASGNLEFF